MRQKSPLLEERHARDGLLIHPPHLSGVALSLLKEEDFLPVFYCRVTPG